MDPHRSHPVTLHILTNTLALQGAKLRDAFQKLKPCDLSPNTIQDLTNLTEMLNGIGEKLEALKLNMATRRLWLSSAAWLIPR